MAGPVINALKPFIPKVAIDLYKALFVPKVWQGHFASWEEAQTQCEGYGKQEILEKIVASALAVKEGRAAYERDSVTFKEEKTYPPLLEALALASASSTSLNIIDFGGSLGSTYYQHLKFMKQTPTIKWNIVEQAHYVEKGKALFESNQLKFHFTIEDISVGENELLTLLSVLPYLPKPWEFLETVLSQRKPRSVFIDRSYFSYDDEDRITIQTVPPSIYRASYPCWFFSETKLKSLMSKYNYELLLSFQCDGQADIPAAHKGFFFQKKS